MKYLLYKPNRHGKPRFYVRLPGRKMIRLPGIERHDDPRLGPLYAAPLNGVEFGLSKPPGPATKAAHGSLGALCEAYFAFLTKDTTLTGRTKYIRRRHLEELCREPLQPGSAKLVGDMPVHQFTSANLQKLLDRKRATPEASNDRRKVVSAMFRWAIPRGHAKSNPVEGTVRIKTNSEGFRPWTMGEVERFMEVHSPGTKAHLALALLLYTGQRRGDVVGLGRQHVKDGRLEFKQQKGGKQLRIPILPPLQEVLNLVPRDQLTFLVTEFGKPFTPAGFGNWFRDQCDKAALKGSSAHGLRKAFLTVASHHGLTTQELAAWAGHATLKETDRYTKKRDRDLLADIGGKKLIKARFGNESVPPKPPGSKSGTNRG